MEKILNIEGYLAVAFHKKIDKKCAEKIARYLCNLQGYKFWSYLGGDYKIDKNHEGYYGEPKNKEKGIASFVKYFSIEKESMSFKVNNEGSNFKVKFRNFDKRLIFTSKWRKPEQWHLDHSIKSYWELMLLLKDDAFISEVLVTSGISVLFRHFEYTKRQPRQDPSFFGYENFISFFDKDSFSEDRKGKLKEQLLTAALSSDSPKVKQSDDGRFNMIIWTDQMEKESIAKGLEAKEDFIAEHCPEVPLDTDFNTLGDLRIYAGDLAVERLGPDNFFSYYHVHYHIAFKAYMPPYPDKIEEETKKELLHFSNSKSLENGKEIKRIMLIVPIRDLAISLEEDAKKCGVDKLLYVDDLGFFWDLHPDGKWKKVV